MTTEHRSIPDSGRHETKGASTALVNQVNTANGDGSTQFAYVAYANITGKPTYPGFTQAITGFSTAASQLPSATNTALQVEFGGAQTTADVNISAAGLITFNTAGQYLITRNLRFGRSVLAGVAIMFIRHLINGAQSGPSNSIIMDNNADLTPVSSTIVITATAGMTLTTEIIRDSAGVNVGGLYSQTPVASGWSVAPNAAISVFKYRGAV